MPKGQRDQHRPQGRARRHWAARFLSKDGLTAAEMGTALHAFLEHADFAALAAAKQAGVRWTRPSEPERERQVDAQLTAPEIADKLDVRRIRRFCKSTPALLRGG